VSCLSLLLFSALSRAGDDRPFKANFHGFVESVTPPDGDGNYKVVIPLQGTATHLGKFNEYLTHHFNIASSFFYGDAKWAAADGSEFFTDFEGEITSLPDADGWVSFEVTHTIRPGSGKGRFIGAAGGFDGEHGRYNVFTGEDEGGYIGHISY
jgi:hypothetical protein